MAYPNYFATIGTPLARGRDFGQTDLLPPAPPVALVNEAFVEKVFGKTDPIGQPCMSDRVPRQPGADRRGPRPDVPYLIVGVVRDSRYGSPSGDTPPIIYTTFLQTNTGRGQMVLHVRATGEARGIARRLREAVAAIDPTMPMFEVRTLAEEMNAALVQQRLVALLASVFGGLALMLAAVGLYGLLAFGVVQRTGELGIRLALGASRGQIRWLVLRDAPGLVAIGAAIGRGAARLGSSSISTLIYGVTPTLYRDRESPLVTYQFLVGGADQGGKRNQSNCRRKLEPALGLEPRTC
jgi:hypothetical protein